MTLVKASKDNKYLHTHHGLHLNYKGKKWLANVICKAVQVMLKNKRMSVDCTEPPVLPQIQALEVHESET